MASCGVEPEPEHGPEQQVGERLAPEQVEDEDVEEHLEDRVEHLQHRHRLRVLEERTDSCKEEENWAHLGPIRTCGSVLAASEKIKAWLIWCFFALPPLRGGISLILSWIMIH